METKGLKSEVLFPRRTCSFHPLRFVANQRVIAPVFCQPARCDELLCQLGHCAGRKPHFTGNLAVLCQPVAHPPAPIAFAVEAASGGKTMVAGFAVSVSGRCQTWQPASSSLLPISSAVAKAVCEMLCWKARCALELSSKRSGARHAEPNGPSLAAYARQHLALIASEDLSTERHLVAEKIIHFSFDARKAQKDVNGRPLEIFEPIRRSPSYINR